MTCHGAASLVFCADRQLSVAFVSILVFATHRLCSAEGRSPADSDVATELWCDNGEGKFDVDAVNGSWRFVILRLANNDFSGVCKIIFNNQQFSVKSPSDDQMLEHFAVLLKISWKPYDTKQTKAYECMDFHGLLLVIDQSSSKKSPYLSNYLNYSVWVETPAEIFLNVEYGHSKCEFPSVYVSVLGAFSPTNVCQNVSGFTKLVVDYTAYAFASSPTFTNIQPNQAECLTTVNYTLEIFAARSTDAMRLAVLYAPEESSGWSIVLNGKTLTSGETWTADSGNTFLVGYIFSSSRRSVESENEDMSGFTLMVTTAASTAGTVSKPNAEPTSSGSNGVAVQATVSTETVSGNWEIASSESMALREKHNGTDFAMNDSQSENKVIVAASTSAAGFAAIVLVSVLAPILVARHRLRRHCQQGVLHNPRGELRAMTEVSATAAELSDPAQTGIYSNVALQSPEIFVGNTDCNRSELIEDTMVDNDLYS